MIGVTPMKIGTETRGAIIEDVLWENNRVVTCSRPIAAEMKDGAVARNITWHNIQVDACNRPFDLEIMHRQDEPNQKLFSRLENVTIDGLVIHKYKIEGQNYESHIHGLDADHSVNDVQLRNIRLEEKTVRTVVDMELEINEFVHELSISK